MDNLSNNYKSDNQAMAKTHKLNIKAFLSNPITYLKAVTWLADGAYIMASVIMLLGGFGVITFGAQIFGLVLPFTMGAVILPALGVGALVSMGLGLYKEYDEQQKVIRREAELANLEQEIGTNYREDEEKNTYAALLQATLIGHQKDGYSPIASTHKTPAGKKLARKIGDFWELGRSCYSGFKNAHRIALVVPVALISLGVISSTFLTLPLGFFVIPVIGCFFLFGLSMLEGRIRQQRQTLVKRLEKAKKSKNKQDSILGKHYEAITRQIAHQREQITPTTSGQWRIFLETLVYGADGFYLVASGLFLITLLMGIVLQAASMGPILAVAFALSALLVTGLAAYFSAEKEMHSQWKLEKWKMRISYWQEALVQPEATVNKVNEASDTILYGIKLGKLGRWVFCGLKNGHRSATSMLVLLVALGLLSVTNVLSLGAIGMGIAIATALVTCGLTLASSILREQREAQMDEYQNLCHHYESQATADTQVPKADTKPLMVNKNTTTAQKATQVSEKQPSCCIV